MPDLVLGVVCGALRLVLGVASGCWVWCYACFLVAGLGVGSCFWLLFLVFVCAYRCQASFTPDVGSMQIFSGCGISFLPFPHLFLTYKHKKSIYADFFSNQNPFSQKKDSRHLIFFHRYFSLHMQYTFCTRHTFSLHITHACHALHTLSCMTSASLQ